MDSVDKKRSTKEKTDEPKKEKPRKKSVTASDAKPKEAKKTKTPKPDSPPADDVDQKPADPPAPKKSKSTKTTDSKPRSSSTTEKKKKAPPKPTNPSPAPPAKAPSPKPAGPKPKVPKDVNLGHLETDDRGLIKITQKDLDRFSNVTKEGSGFISPADAKIKAAEKLTQWKKVKDATGDCPICMCELGKDDVVQMSQCVGHQFHKDCLSHCIDERGPFLRCPSCFIVYGTRIGNMPKGTMQVNKTNSMHCEGFERHPTIVIEYNFPDGKQGPEHRLPGAYYSGTSRTCYLPDTPEGNEVLKLLDIAFKRQLTFTIGMSITNGSDNTVVWNGIHHKTSLSGGFTNYGFPDDTYFARVKQELKDVGVV